MGPRRNLLTAATGVAAVLVFAGSGAVQAAPTSCGPARSTAGICQPESAVHGGALREPMVPDGDAKPGGSGSRHDAGRQSRPDHGRESGVGRDVIGGWRLRDACSSMGCGSLADLAAALLDASDVGTPGR